MTVTEVRSWNAQSPVGGALQAVLDADPDLVGQDSRILAAYFSLPPTWRSALWLHEVEGASPSAVARRLRLSHPAARRAVRSARAALKRHAAAQHEATRVGQPGSRNCGELVSKYAATPPAYLSRKDATELREHARHCDGCAPLMRDILLLDHGLRRRLVRLPLEEPGPKHATPRPGRHAAPRASRGDSVLARNPGRTLVGSLSLTAAAVGVGVMLKPVPGPGAAPGGGQAAADLSPLTRPVAIGATGPAGGGPTSAVSRLSERDASGTKARTTSVSSRRTSATDEAQPGADAPTPADSSEPPAPGNDGPAAPPPSGEPPPPPDAGPGPADPPPAEPPPAEPPPDDPPPSPTGLPSVEAEVGDDGADITVDPGPVPVPPVEVGVELPG